MPARNPTGISVFRDWSGAGSTPLIETSIIIPTFQRPELLRRAVTSCLRQQGAGPACEIIVVDNNPDGAARPIVEELAAQRAVPIRYIAEPRPGISFARNTGVAIATGRYVAFLDDDEEAEPGWLSAHLDTIRRFGADVVVGPVRPNFPAGTPQITPYQRSRFTRVFASPTGLPPPRITGIGNTLVNRQRCLSDGEPFDPRFALIGGEDTLFMRQQLRRGRKIVWCAEAGVREAVPPHRLEARFLLRRAFMRGQVTTFACAAVKPPLRAQVVRMMAVGCLQAVLFGIPALVLRGLQDRRWLPLMDRALLGLGKLLWQARLRRSFYR